MLFFIFLCVLIPALLLAYYNILPLVLQPLKHIQFKQVSHVHIINSFWQRYCPGQPQPTLNTSDYEQSAYDANNYTVRIGYPIAKHNNALRLAITLHEYAHATQHKSKNIFLRLAFMLCVKIPFVGLWILAIVWHMGALMYPTVFVLQIDALLLGASLGLALLLLCIEADASWNAYHFLITKNYVFLAPSDLQHIAKAYIYFLISYTLPVLAFGLFCVIN